MPRRFLTERDIRDYVAQGVKELLLEPDAVVTELGKECARAAGMKLLWQPRTTAPARPSSAPGSAAGDLHARVRAAVIARLGQAPDGLDAFIAQVLKESQG